MTTSAEIQIQTDVAARMRDGVTLRADVYRPADTGTFPVLLTRTPYGKGVEPTVADSARAFAQRGYIAVVQDVRGRFASEGQHWVLADDIDDGFDSILWAAALAGSSGVVGMFGGSYGGYAQLWAAAQQPAPLKAIVPVMSGPSLYDRYDGGAFKLGDWLGWLLGHSVETADRLEVEAPELRRYVALGRERLAAMLAGDREAVARGLAAIRQLGEPWLRHLPLATLPVLQGLAPHYYEWLAHPAYDEYWHTLDIEHRFPLWDLPCFSLAGWYDPFLRGNLDTFTALRAHSRTPESRQAQRLLIGPWTHGPISTSQAGDFDFGPDAAIDALALQVRWFDQWLKGIDTGLLGEPPVRLFVMGANRWRDEWEWPLARTRYVPYYFHSGGKANTLNGDGSLGPERPGEEPPDSFVYDPDDPVSSIGGKTGPFWGAAGPLNQRPVEQRPDVLCYTTPLLTRDLEVTGPLKVTLHAASSAADTDWTVKLVDVHPTGYAQNLQEGILRASHRVPGAAPAPIRPNEVYEYVIDLWATSNVFLAGHRLRVELSSSNFPHWDRNTNAGLPPARADRGVTARQRIFHDAAYPSHILLPTIPST